jgi:hypothetical protein
MRTLTTAQSSWNYGEGHRMILPRQGIGARLRVGLILGMSIGLSWFMPIAWANAAPLLGDGSPDVALDRGPALKGDDSIERLLILQRQVAASPEDEDARRQLRALLDRLGADQAAYDIPSGANLADLGWWHTLWPTVQRKAWLSMHAGHDSNINSGTESSVIQVPLVNYRSLAVDDLLREKPSNFLLLQGGGRVAVPVSDWLSWAAEARGAWRYNSALYEYFPHSYSGNIAAIVRGGPAKFRLAAGSEQHWLANYRLVSASGPKLEVELPVRDGFAVRADARRLNKRYPTFLDIRTVDHAYGMAVVSLQSGSGISLDAGDESSPNGLSDMDRRYASFSMRMNMTVGASGLAMAECRHTDSDYKNISPLFLVKREDRHTACYLGYQQSLGHGWSWGPALLLERNASSLSLMAYTRTQIMVGARKEF